MGGILLVKSAFETQPLEILGAGYSGYRSWIGPVQCVIMSLLGKSRLASKQTCSKQ